MINAVMIITQRAKQQTLLITNYLHSYSNIQIITYNFIIQRDDAERIAVVDSCCRPYEVTTQYNDHLVRSTTEVAQIKRNLFG